MSRKRKAALKEMRQQTKSKKARLTNSSEETQADGKRRIGKVIAVKEKNILVKPEDDAEKSRDNLSILKRSVATGGMAVYKGDSVSYLQSSRNPFWGHAAELIRVEHRRDEDIEYYLEEAERMPKRLLSDIQRCPAPWVYLCQRQSISSQTFLLLLKISISLAKIGGNFPGQFSYFFDSLTESPAVIKKLKDFSNSKDAHRDQSLVKQFLEVVASEAPDKFYRLIPAVEEFCLKLNEEEVSPEVIYLPNYQSFTPKVPPKSPKYCPQSPEYFPEPLSCIQTSPKEIRTSPEPASLPAIFSPTSPVYFPLILNPITKHSPVPFQRRSPSPDPVGEEEQLASQNCSSDDLMRKNKQIQMQATFAMDLVRLLSFGAAGKSGDIRALKWNCMPVLPSLSELKNEVNASLMSTQLPSVKVRCPYTSVDEYLETYFQLLREDCFYHLRHGIQQFLHGRLDFRDMHMCRVLLKGVQIMKSGFHLCLSFHMLNQGFNWRKSNFLMRENLVCISLGCDFTEVFWATITGRDEKLLKEGLVFVSPVPKCAKMSKIIQDLRACSLDGKTGKVALMAESPTYYRAFQPVLKCLQIRKGGIPFQSELVDLERDARPPKYLKGCKANFNVLFTKRPVSEMEIVESDLQPFEHSLSSEAMWETPLSAQTDISDLQENTQPSETIVENFERLLKESGETTLDESQQKAIKHCLENRLAIVQGPPGTGKSFIGIKLVELLLSLSRDVSGPILVLTYKNHALDRFLEDCLLFCKKIIRIGGRSRSVALESYNLIEKRKNYTKPFRGRHDEARRHLIEAVSQLLRQSRFFSLSDFENSISWKQLEKFCQQYPRLNQDLQQEVSDSRFNEFVSKRRIFLCYSKEIWNLVVEWMPSTDEFERVKIEQPVSFFMKSRLKSFSTDSANSFREDYSEEETAEVLIDRLLHPEKTKSWKNPKKGFVNFHEDNAISESSMKIPEVQVPLEEIEKDALQGEEELWSLTARERVLLVCCWREKKLRQTSLKCEELNFQVNGNMDEDMTWDIDFDSQICQNASILGMTVTGAAINHLLIERISPSVVIVEEAAEILEAQLVAVLPSSVKHLIMLGDHEQLRPQIQCDELRRKNRIDVSMFERLIKGRISFVQLEYQCRMREEFVDTFRHIYPSLKTNKDLVKNNNPPHCIGSSMFFWTHSIPEDVSTFSRSHRNEAEIEEILSVVRLLLHENYKPESITVLTTYTDQLRTIREKLSRKKIEKVVTSTVDEYQGRENDIVLVSLVRSNALSQIGFLRQSNRMCVAASRARCGMYFFGNAKILSERSYFWKNLINVFRRKELLGQQFPLFCPRHPERKMTVNSCSVLCSETMVCGHTCSDFCHPTGKHKDCKTVVNHPCENCNVWGKKFCYILEENYRCRNTVSDVCKDCEEKTERRCCDRPITICTFPCARTLPCEHPCPKRCSEPCPTGFCQKCETQAEKQREGLSSHIKIIAAEKLRELRQPNDLGSSSLQEVKCDKEKVQRELEWFLPPSNGRKVLVTSIKQSLNDQLLKKWLVSLSKVALATESEHCFALLPISELPKVLKRGASCLSPEMTEWKRTLKKGVDFCIESEEELIALQFKIVKGKCKRVERKDDIKSALKEEPGFDSVSWRSDDGENFVLRTRNLALLDLIVKFKIVNDDSIFNLGISLNSEVYQIRELIQKEECDERREDDLLFREAESQFYRMLDTERSSYVVTGVHLVDNGTLNRRFDDTKEKFKRDGRDCSVTFAFHGTTEHALEKICEEGFKIGGKGVEIRSGKRYGEGIYTAKNPKTSIFYATSQKLFLCRVLKGKYEEDYKHGADEKIFVLTSESQIVPKYIVNFKPRTV